jgi:hypothetical protein
MGTTSQSVVEEHMVFPVTKKRSAKLVMRIEGNLGRVKIILQGIARNTVLGIEEGI